MPQFEFSTYYSQIFWLVVVFSFLYFVISKFVSPSAERIFTNRNNVLETEINEASEMTSVAEELKTQYNAELSYIEDITDNIRKEAKISLDKSLALKLLNLEKELNVKAKKHSDDIIEATEIFLRKETEASVNLASFIIEKITHRKANEELLISCYNKVR
jgi:F-type H+-transporting ATPase subunit b